METRLIDVRGRMARVIRRIEEDDDASRMLLDRLKALEVEELALTNAVAAEPVRTVVRLPANYELVYRRAVEQLELHLRSDDGNGARAATRLLIEKVVDLLPKNHGIGKLPRQMETSDAARPFYLGSDHRRAA